MKNKMFKFCATLLLSSVALSLANAFEEDYEEDYAIEFESAPSVEAARQDTRVVGADNYVHLSNPSCGIEIGRGQIGVEYILDDDITCSPGALSLKGPNAAITLLGENNTLRLNGKSILCFGDRKNKSSDPTNEVSSIGVHMQGVGGKLIGVEEGKHGYATIAYCNDSVEVGTVSSAPSNDTDIPKSTGEYSIIEKVQALKCNTGFKILSSGVEVRYSKASCGKYFEEREESSHGFVVGINALEIDNADCYSGNELYPPVENTKLIDNIATGNSIGFLGGSQLRVNSVKHSNVMQQNLAKNNQHYGYLISGTGFAVSKNTAFKNAGVGMAIARTHPLCGPQDVIVNKMHENESTYNGSYGIASLIIKEKNQGNEFALNNVSDNKAHQLYAAAQDCANGASEYGILDEWKRNRAGLQQLAYLRPSPACTRG